MEKSVKSLKKSLDILARRKVNYKTNRFLHSKIGEDTEFIKLPMYNYHKNVSKVSRETDNKRSMMYPVYPLNTLVHFTNKEGDSLSAFTIKWYKDKLVREAGIYGVYIYANPEESNTIYFITIYSLLVNGKPNKSFKTTITEFNFDNNDLVKLSNSTTDLNESLKSVGYVLLYMLSQYNNMIRYNTNKFESFSDFFINDFPDGEQEDIEKLNMSNILGMLNTDEDIEDEDLLIYKSM